MRKSIIPLWLTLFEVKMRLRLSVNHTDSQCLSEEKELNNVIETVTYEITGVGELSRIVELKLMAEDSDSIFTSKRFHKLSVHLQAAKGPEKKYAGRFFYYSKDMKGIGNSKTDDSPLSLYLNVPEVLFNRFCNEIASKRIANICVSIQLEAFQEDDVGAFGPPDLDDAVYIEGGEGFIEGNRFDKPHERCEYTMSVSNKDTSDVGNFVVGVFKFVGFVILVVIYAASQILSGLDL